MAGIFWGLVLLGFGYAALVNRDRLERFGAGIHPDWYAALAAKVFVFSLLAMGSWTSLLGSGKSFAAGHYRYQARMGA